MHSSSYARAASWNLASSSFSKAIHESRYCFHCCLSLVFHAATDLASSWYLVSNKRRFSLYCSTSVRSSPKKRSKSFSRIFSELGSKMAVSNEISGVVNASGSACCEDGGGCDGYEQLRPSILLSTSCHGSAFGRRINASSRMFISADCVFCVGAAKCVPALRVDLS